MPNPFAKTRPQHQPYAIYRAGNMVWHVCKTYQMPKKEEGNMYARWFVWAKSDATFGSFEGGDTYASDVRNHGRLVAADPEWMEHYYSGVTNVPTPEEYLWQTANV